MTLLIHDANVLIDLIDIGLLDEALGLPFRMTTTDLVQREIEAPDQARALAACVSKGRLDVITSTAQQMSAIAESLSHHGPLSLADCSVLYHAVELDGIILSGDGQLRKAAAACQREVHGTPWMIAQLESASVIETSVAIEKLEVLLCVNLRQPRRECKRLLDSWKIKVEGET
jgi:hypothetical protein